MDQDVFVVVPSSVNDHPILHAVRTAAQATLGWTSVV
jgi:hypothetical protein